MAGEPDRVTGLRRLYVCLTRAVTSLVVLHTSAAARRAGGMTPRRAGGPWTAREDVRDELLAAYADPGRGYHDTRHLTEVLDRLDELAAAGEAFDRRRCGWPRGSTTASTTAQPGAEERSARWAETRPAGAGCRRRTVAEVARLVRLTEHHRPADDDRERLRALRRRPGDPGGRPRSGTPSTSRPCGASTPTSPTTTSAPAGPRSCATCSPSRTCSTPRTAARAWEAPARANVRARAGAAADRLATLPTCGAAARRRRAATTSSREDTGSAPALDQPVVVLRRHVVVVAVEAPGGDAERRGRTRAARRRTRRWPGATTAGRAPAPSAGRSGSSAAHRVQRSGVVEQQPPGADELGVDVGLVGLPPGRTWRPEVELA